MSPLHFNFSVPSHFPSPAFKAVDKVIQQVFIEHLLMSGTMFGLKESGGWGAGEGRGKPPEQALHFQPWLAPLRTFLHSLLFWTLPKDAL